MNVSAFAGINNVSEATRLKPGELSAARDIDITSTGAAVARRGRTLLLAGAAHSLHETYFGLLAAQNNDLLLLDASTGAVQRTVMQSIGPKRIWYVQLPDGRVGYSNGLVNGVAGVFGDTPWGVPVPPDAGYGTAGGTPYQITYTRLFDQREGPPCYGPAIDPSQPLVGLPQMDGYRINVYLAPAGQMYLAATTTTDFADISGPLGVSYFAGPLAPLPVGKLMTQWGARTLVAAGKTLWASAPFDAEHCDPTKDFVQFEDEITLAYAVPNGGVFVGTTRELLFLAGATLSDARLQTVAPGAVTLGSGVEVPLHYMAEKQRPDGQQDGALCLVDGYVHLLFGAGQALPLTAERYRYTASEVRATARVRDGALQYLASPV